jgi:hypothetical protein
VVETSAVPTRNPASSSRTIDGQAVIAISEMAQIHILNDVGTRVWNLIDGSRTVSEITALVTRQLEDEGYEGVSSTVAADIEEFFEAMAAKEMVSLGPVRS